MLLAADDMPTILDGHPTAANIVRLAIIFVGFTLALLSLKVAIRESFRSQEWERVFGAVSYAFFVAAPGVAYLWRFDQPLTLPLMVAYVAGLTFGVIASYYRITLRWLWVRRIIERRQERESARR